MNRLGLQFLHLLFVLKIFSVKAQFNPVTDEASSQDSVSNFRPSLAVVIGILCIMFFLTFILLVYAKFCRGSGASVQGALQNLPALVRSTSQYSGVDKTVIESLPFFRFSSLKGSKNGLECVVCLSKFEDIEVLRLLPKCKHAFHINCVDQWLEKHSSCPLCRCKVSAEDPAIFSYSNSMRFYGNQSDHQEDSNVELFVQREETHQGSSRFSIGSSFRKVDKFNNKDEEALIRQEADGSDDDQKILHKFNHKIIISDVVLKNRWSSVSSSDLMFLNSEMLQDMSSNRFSSLDWKNNEQFTTAKAIEDKQIMKIKEQMEMKRLFENKVRTIDYYTADSFPGHPSTSDSNAISSHSIMNSAERRSVSEITALSRFRNLSIRNTIRESFSGENNRYEERQRRLWLPIARRTVQWFANRERRSQPTKNTTQTLDV
ncbi:E3 ubiquitin-protein ligase ATL42 [Manihot esculenta]|uniref:RING-type E3 ubiquitin transferase n=1 Tax=Manihot esculenta TaxID=3983 RepID=A0A2C9UAS9_MANES|nr:E3 ubiquitin-protein ligase ATL42 [Manihot esculenta]OAY27256.1 hypothetical protein MANES_16G111700v8 [Manihot esculenta]